MGVLFIDDKSGVLKKRGVEHYWLGCSIRLPFK
jgi:hypothetical protein